MNCAEVRELLPALLYGDLAPAQKVVAEDHLVNCLHCRDEQAALAEVRRLLDAAAVPNVQIDVNRIFADANRLQRKQMRRWRRAALVTLGAAAALLVAFGLKLEVRWESRQLVLRWGLPAVAVPEPKPPLVVERRPAPVPPPEVTAADLQLVRELVHNLAATVDERDGKVRQNLAQLGFQLNLVQEQASARWATTERYVSALYTSQMDSHVKGEK